MTRSVGNGAAATGRVFAAGYARAIESASQGA